jgi:inhibitor of the pro-sigma K processing machinery
MAIAAGGILSEILIVIGIFLVLYIIFKLGKFILGLIVNVILGFIAIFVVNALFGLGLSWDLITVIITALLGLPGVALLVILKLLGISV